MLRTLYHALVSSEHRYLFYKLRHPAEFRELRQKVHPSPKGDFSLCPFDRYQCLFVHVTKSAGTSVAKSLFGYLPYHYTAVQYRVIYGRNTFNRYFKFAFVRNPWDRLYSAYTYLCKGGWNERDRQWFNQNLSNVPDFNAFVLDWLSPGTIRSHLHFRPQSDFICDRKGYPLIDWIGYFETLPEDFAAVAERLGIESRLDHVNASGGKGYRNIYSTKAADRVHELYQQDIQNLGYSFDRIITRKTINAGRFKSL